MRRSRILVLVAVVAVVQVGLFLAYPRDENVRVHPRPPLRLEEIEGDVHASPIELERLDGTIEALPAAPGRPTLVHFWATWCPPCRAEMPRLLELVDRLERSGQARVVLVSVDPEWPAVEAFFAGRIPPEVRRDPGQNAARAYGVTTLPDTYLVDEAGRIRLRLAGAQDWTDPRLRAALTEHRSTVAR